MSPVSRPIWSLFAAPLMLSLSSAMLLWSSGCTLLTDFSECEADTDCPSGLCEEGICSGAVACTTRAQCFGVSAEAYCLSGSCAVIDTTRCPRLGKVFSEDADGVIIPVGALMPLSGTNKEKGEAASDGAELALRQINASGGSTVGKFGLIACDTGYLPDKAVENANYLHDQLGVQAMIGAISSAESLAVVDQVATPKDVLLISPASTSPGLSRRSDQFWRTIPSDALQAPEMARLLKQRGIDDVAVLYGGESDPYGSGFFNALSFYWAENPSEKPASVRVGTFSSSSPIDSLGKVNEEALYGGANASSPPQAIVLIGSLASSDLLAAVEENYVRTLPAAQRPLWVLTEAMRDRALLEKPGIKPAYGRIIGTAPLRTETPIYATYETLLRATFMREARDYQFPDKAYDAAFLIALTYGAQQDPLTATGGQLSQVLDRVTATGTSYNLLGTEYSRIAGALREGQSVNLVGASSGLDFDENHDVTGTTMTTWEIDISSGSPEFVESSPTTN